MPNNTEGHRGLSPQAVYAFVTFGVIVVGINVLQHLYQRDLDMLPRLFGAPRAAIADVLMLVVIVINGLATVTGLVSAAFGLLRFDRNIGFLVQRIQQLEQQLRSDEALFNRLESELAPLAAQAAALRGKIGEMETEEGAS